MVASAAMNLLQAALWLYVATMLARRPVPDSSRLPSRLFASWWLALGLHSLLLASLALAGAFGVRSGTLVVAAIYVGAVLLPMMFFGLLAYLLYIYTGSIRLVRGLAALYGVQLVGFLALIASFEPQGIRVGRGWNPGADYGDPPARAGNIAIAAGFVLPPLIASMAYLRLYSRVDDATRRWRIALVGGAIFVWFLGLLLQPVVAGTAAHFTVRLLGILAALAVIFAYEPPKGVAARYGVHRLDEEPVALPIDPLLEARRNAALAERAEQLI